ncbi:hypothetical protein UF66_0829 [Staphylococcus cohnii subsp. cohnii]|uniref:Uncharacterized protein n=1 Tax=Staphylococcus cohnii subsp. cohnii TaxID=74704 RepID=A0A0M2NTP3_STACC|nr:hypothetical protein UF66_0829 [Staphylococcus cohnii subsp. cohnii]
MYLTKSSSIGTPNPQPIPVGWGFFLVGYVALLFIVAV